MIPPVTKNMIIINVLFFLGTIVAERYGIDLNNFLGLHFFLADNFNPAQFFTYMFMHGGWSHLSFNMFAVWMFGCVLIPVIISYLYFLLTESRNDLSGGKLLIVDSDLIILFISFLVITLSLEYVTSGGN